jgi:hypothetical protein
MMFDNLLLLSTLFPSEDEALTSGRELSDNLQEWETGITGAQNEFGDANPNSGTTHLLGTDD